MKQIEIYTDGACSGNPGKGGYGVVLKYGDIIKELFQGYELTTNNRMELMGVIVALESLKEPCEVQIYSDSKYIVDAVNQGWAVKWKAKGWMRNKKDKAQNPDLWKRLLNNIEKHSCTFNWVKGHNGHEYNEICDDLAVAACHSDNLIEDVGYNVKN